MEFTINSSKLKEMVVDYIESALCKFPDNCIIKNLSLDEIRNMLKIEVAHIIMNGTLDPICGIGIEEAIFLQLEVNNFIDSHCVSKKNDPIIIQISKDVTLEKDDTSADIKDKPDPRDDDLPILKSAEDITWLRERL